MTPDGGPGSPDHVQVKHTVQLPLALWADLERRANSRGITKSEALRRAVWLFTYLSDRMDDGTEVALVSRDGKRERLVIAPY
jgi:hypothetical protein